jgi:hypothetical protein
VGKKRISLIKINIILMVKLQLDENETSIVYLYSIHSNNLIEIPHIILNHNHMTVKLRFNDQD